MALTKISTDGFKDDAVTTDKLANAINTERTANTAKVSTTINNNADNRVITGSGTANTLEGESNIHINGGTLIAGHTASTTTSNGEGPFIQAKGTDSRAGASFIRHSADAAGSGLYIGKSRNATIGSNTVVQDDDELGRITFSGDDGTDINTVGVEIAAHVDGTPGSNDMPGRLTFRTTADGAAGTTERMRIDHSGNVGISATSLSDRLTIGDGDLKFYNSDEGNNHRTTFIEFGNSSNRITSESNFGSAGSSAYSAGYKFTTKNYTGSAFETVNAMAIQARGTVLFGTTDSTSVGVMFFRSATSPYPRIMHQGSGSSFANHTLIEFRSTVDGVIGEIKQDGDSTITYATSSDYRLKENIIDLTGAITRLKNLKPRRFNFKKNPSYTKDGFLAHELQEVIPEAVNGTKDEVVTEDSKANMPQLAEEEVGSPVYQTADLARVVPLLTAALQEAITKIETLETKVAALEAA